MSASSSASTPQRIGYGFLGIIALSLLLGLWAIAQIFAINQNVTQLATNSIPSIVALNKIIQQNATADRAAAEGGRGTRRCPDLRRRRNDLSDGSLGRGQALRRL